MFVHILLAPEGVDAMRTGRSESAGSGVLRALRALEVELQPIHPGIQDEILERYFVVEADDEHQARQIAERLVGEDGVEAAYVKPPEGPPSDTAPL